MIYIWCLWKMGRFWIIKNIFKVHILFYITAFFMAVTGHFKLFTSIFFIIFIHEMGHLLMALLLKWKIDKVIILPFGAVTIFNEDINKPIKEEFLIAFFGPLFQIIYTFLNPNILEYSLFLLIFNLLPIFPLDGSKFLNLFLNLFISFKKSHLLSLIISFICIFVILSFFRFNIFCVFVMLFIFLKTLDEYLNHRCLFNKFLYERLNNNYKFKKTKIIKGKNVFLMRRDYKHIFYDKIYKTEREILKERFDFNRKLW